MKKGMGIMENNRNSGGTVGGVGFVGLLTIVFIVLKLCKVISWKWIWVLSPIWIGAIATVVICLILLVIYYILSR